MFNGLISLFSAHRVFFDCIICHNDRQPAAGMGKDMSKLTFVFVHGLSGWGSYDAQYQRMPYWGMRGGDLMKSCIEKAPSCSDTG